MTKARRPPSSLAFRSVRDFQCQHVAGLSVLYSATTLLFVACDQVVVKSHSSTIFIPPPARTLHIPQSTMPILRSQSRRYAYPLTTAAVPYLGPIPVRTCQRCTLVDLPCNSYASSIVCSYLGRPT